MEFFYTIFSFFLIICLLAFLYWRFYFFFRDPERKIPYGNNIVSPADGTIVYIKKIIDGSVPLLIKNKEKIILNEILKTNFLDIKDTYFIIGIFMHPTDIHINRAPISGIVKKIIYTKGKNLPMTKMWWRVLLRKKPYELYSKHIFTNERNVVYIEGEIPIFIVQIADIYVSKIVCYVKENEKVEKGHKIGMIRMGSQVDIIFPDLPSFEIGVVEGQKVKAGETVIASYKS